jgi:predicted component of type VI protein secretion system
MLNNTVKSINIKEIEVLEVATEQSENNFMENILRKIGRLLNTKQISNYK